jgi:hypothetical protein
MLFWVIAIVWVLALLLIAQQCSRATLASGANLLLNGDAEAGPGSPNGTKVMRASGWNATGLFNVVQYGAGEFPGPNVPGPANRGRNFFAGGPDGNVSTATQVVDVSNRARAIDAKDTECQLSGYLGGYGGQNDNAVLAAEFQGAASQKLGAVAIGPVLAADRDRATGLVLRTASAPVPPGTRRIAVTLTMTRTDGTSNDGYADNLSLTLTNSAPK